MILSQRQPVCVLCLGADADFSIERVRQRTENRDAVNSTNLRTASGKAAKADTLRVNMVHGDIAIFKGDDFHVRTFLPIWQSTIIQHLFFISTLWRGLVSLFVCALQKTKISAE